MHHLFMSAAAGAALVYFFIMLFLIAGFFRLRKGHHNEQPALSVVVAARNEEQKIAQCLQAISRQTYPRSKTEIIVVDDRSTDRTREILRQWQTRLSNLRVLHCDATESSESPKKAALNAGISYAQGEIIFTTDADCRPSPRWLEETAKYFTPETGLVFGPAPFDEENKLWNGVLCLDNLAHAFAAAGAAGWNVGLTGTGRNLAYRKSVFDEVGGFTKIAHSLSGDDDLFLQQVSAETNRQITYALQPQTAVPSAAPANLKQYFTQKRRHTSAGKYYGMPQKLGYLFFHGANLLLFAACAYALFQTRWIALALGFLGGKFTLDFLALYLLGKRLDKRRLLRYFIPWEVFFVLVHTFIAPTAFWGKIRWKA